MLMLMTAATVSLNLAKFSYKVTNTCAQLPRRLSS